MKVKNKDETFEEYTPLTNHINTKLGGDIKGLLIDAKSDACTKRSASNFNKYSSRANHIGMYSDRDNEQQCTKDVDEKETGNKRNYDQNFNEAIEIIFQNEGGFSDNKNDFGGRTNMGITQKTYDDYCKRHNIETKDVKQLTRKEAQEIYYNDYWKPSGADKVKDSVGATILFDTAVLHGVGRAKQFYKESGDNFEKMIELRNKHYDNLVKKYPSQKQNLNGWKNRTRRLSDMLNKE